MTIGVFKGVCGLGRRVWGSGFRAWSSGLMSSGFGVRVGRFWGCTALVVWFWVLGLGQQLEIGSRSVLGPGGADCAGSCRVIGLGSECG